MPGKDPRQLAFWQDEEMELWDTLVELLINIFGDGVAEGVANLPANARMLVDFDWINQSALNFAKTYRYDWITKITDTTRTQVQQAITDWMREGSPLPALESRLAPIFGQVRAEMIAVTETTRIYAEGNDRAWKSTGVVSDEGKWQTAVDERVCPLCSPLHNKITKEKPPLHPRCRCGRLPVVDEDLYKKKLAEIFA